MRLLPLPRQRLPANIFLLCWLAAFPAVGLVHSLHQQRSARLWLALTTESFKLADLQCLAASIEQPTCQRLLLDGATGSSLLRVDADFPPFQEEPKHDPPVFLQRCQWTGVVLASGATPRELIDQIHHHQQQHNNIVEDDDPAECVWLQHPWTLNYLCLSSSAKKPTHSASRRSYHYTATTLLCAVSQAIRAPPAAALDPRVSSEQPCLDRLLLIDTSSTWDVGQQSAAADAFYFLVKKLDVSIAQSWSSSLLDDKKWSKRPFPYSSAMNPKIAELVLDILVHLTQQRRVENNSTHDNMSTATQAIRFLDPCCGSGTFLAAALDRGMHATGYDVNEKCVQGTLANLRHVFGSSSSSDDGDDDSNDDHRYEVYEQDSTITFDAAQQKGRPPFDCSACNLPWDLNTKTSFESNIKILTTLRQHLKQGAPCAIVSKGTEDSPFLANKDLEQLGFRTVGQAQVPPKSFKLPTGNKKRKKQNADSSSILPKDKGRSHCLITIVEAM